MARNFMVSVYPDHRVHAIVGNGSADFNRAIECWATILTAAANDNSHFFDRDEWNCLAARLGPINRGRRPEMAIPPHYARPGEFLSGLMGDTPLVAKKLAELDFTHAWAVLKAIDWRLALDERIDPKKDRWWLPGFWEKTVAEYEVA